MQCAMSVHVFEFKLNIFQSNVLLFCLQIIAKMKKGESVDEDVD